MEVKQYSFFKIVTLLFLVMATMTIIACSPSKKDGNKTPQKENARSLNSTMVDFEGIIVNQKNTPIPDVAVTIVSGPGTHTDISPLSNEQGIFSFSDLPAGTYTLKFVGEDGNMVQEVEIKEGLGTVQFKMD